MPSSEDDKLSRAELMQRALESQLRFILGRQADATRRRPPRTGR
ncbi:MAG: hypothetical protein ACT4OM_13340 [Actinomycetota bacterium]